MPGRRIRRARKFQERPWLWLGISLVLALGSFAGVFFGIRALQEARTSEADPMYWFLVGLGGLGLLLILVTFVYSARKRALQERFHVGTMMGWLNSHVYLGLVALVVIVAHAFLFPFSGRMTSGKIAFFVFAALVISGILWRLVYRTVPPRVAGTVGNLAIVDTRKKTEALKLELEKLQAGRSREFDALVNDVTAGVLTRREKNRRCRALSESERALWADIAVIIDDIEWHAQRERRQRRYSKVLQAWRAVHLPLALALLVMIGFHLYDVFNVDRNFQEEPARAFASSEDCAQCHNAIVDEWKTSMHRNAQTSTITVAQAPVTLGEQPGWGQICVACHSPIAVKFSDRTTYPMADPHPLDNPNSVEEEGITCVVCHSLPHRPKEIEGADSNGLQIIERDGLSLGTQFGPPLDGGKLIPNSTHDVRTGFMKDDIRASQMCAACHNVQADIDGDGIVQEKFRQRKGGNPNQRFPSTRDDDNDGVLNENEIDIEDGQFQDLALQTTFNEWEDYIAAQGGKGESCVDCHMPAIEAPVVDNPPPALPEISRSRSRHIFVGVDYDMNDEYYRQPGMPEDAMEEVLHDREELVTQSVIMTVDGEGRIEGPQTQVSVKLENITGHAFPSGFAFARQWWIKIAAKTADGDVVCLADAPNGIRSPCASGIIQSPTEELKTCEPGGINQANIDIEFTVTSPLENCDPWLTNFQKILTDGGRGARSDPQGPFREVAFQTLTNDIVKLRERAADGFVTGPLAPFQSTEIPYTFDTAGLQGEQLKVTAVLRLRHLPPYFVKALNDTMPGDLTAKALLENMTVVNAASNRPLRDPLTSPAVEEFTTEELGGFLEASDDTVENEKGSTIAALAPFGLLPLLLLGAILLHRRWMRVPL
ncbi:MAG: cytochrome c family protein [Actinomycetota bacterium]|nr:cytochrome c family protein [Actinomycetota bacterium]